MLKSFVQIACETIKETVRESPAPSRQVRREAVGLVALTVIAVQEDHMAVTGQLLDRGTGTVVVPGHPAARVLHGLHVDRAGREVRQITQLPCDDPAEEDLVGVPLRHQPWNEWTAHCADPTVLR